MARKGKGKSKSRQPTGSHVWPDKPGKLSSDPGAIAARNTFTVPAFAGLDSLDAAIERQTSQEAHARAGELGKINRRHGRGNGAGKSDIELENANPYLKSPRNWLPETQSLKIIETICTNCHSTFVAPAPDMLYIYRNVRPEVEHAKSTWLTTDKLYATETLDRLPYGKPITEKRFAHRCQNCAKHEQANN